MSTIGHWLWVVWTYQLTDDFTVGLAVLACVPITLMAVIMRSKYTPPKG